jgi:glycosyltransferase involved in cell wall biosynthesis
MKILHVNYSEINGGAAIGVNRLHKALKKKDINSEMLVIEKSTNDPNIHGPNSSFEELFSSSKKILSRFIKKKLIKTNNKETFSFNLFSSNILKKINSINPSVVHLHWIGNEMISISQLKKIKKPIIWTFWDMWPICGAEHHSYDKRFIDGYKKNNRPDHEKGFDLNKFIWNYKKKNYDFEFTVNAPSKWFYNEIKKSLLIKDKKIINITPNLDTNFWHPKDKQFSRDIYQFDKNDKILLFGSATSTNHRKGFDFLIKLFEKKKFINTKLIIFGERPKNLDKLKIDYKYIGKISDDVALSTLYSSADILLVPSMIEVFGQVGLEAQACGTPCIVFENTGLIDFVKHKETGYVSKHNDIDDFFNGINWILEKDVRYREISAKGTKITKESFDDEVIVKQFIKEYKNLLS